MTKIKTTKGEREYTAEYDFGDNLQDAIAKFGEEVVFSSYKRSQTISYQNVVRRLLDAGKTDEEIAAAMAPWKPGVAMERTSDPVAALLAKWDKLPEEQKAKVIAKLKGG